MTRIFSGKPGKHLENENKKPIGTLYLYSMFRFSKLLPLETGLRVVPRATRR